MEIERKFLVSRLPDAFGQYPHERMEQAYISTDPLIRIRRAGERYVLTCKGRGLLSREEFETEMTGEAYQRLLTKTEGLRIVKNRYKIPLGTYTAEVDIFAPPLEPLTLVEVEFPTEDAAKAFAPPDWFGREVTRNPAYTNAALSQHGVPEDNYDPKDLKSVLAYMRNQFGAEIFETPSRVHPILLDLAPGLKREGNVLRQMSEAGLLRELRQASESGAEADCARAVAKGRDWLTDYLMLPDEKADYFMTALQAAYGLETEPPKPSAPPSPPTPKPTPQPKPAPPPMPKPGIIDSGVTGDCRWTLDSDGVLTVSGCGRMGEYSEKKAPPWWMHSIKTVLIKHGVTSVGTRAFRDCPQLTSVTIPDSVTVIESFAFRHCSRLTGVTIPDGVVSIESCAFDGCSSLTSVTIPRSVTSIEQYAFDDCDKLKQVSVARRTTIHAKAFDSRTKVTRR